jgi:probable rRNA maturation factor
VAAVRRLVASLDAGFRPVPADLPHLSPGARARARAALRAPVGEAAGSLIPPGDVSLAFLTDAALAKLHRRFLDDPSVTDVITFEGDSLAGTAGEVCVSVDAAARQAGAAGLTFAAELTLYVVHGLLHLAGYDDLSPARRRRMRAAERRALDLLRREDAVPAFQRRARTRR